MPAWRVQRDALAGRYHRQSRRPNQGAVHARHLHRLFQGETAKTGWPRPRTDGHRRGAGVSAVWFARLMRL